MKKYFIECLNEGLSDLLQSDDVYLIGEDIQEPYGGAFKVSKGLSDKYPNKIIYTPMSEQGFTGMAVGMALAGLKPIVEIMFGDFITLVVDQLINHAAKFKGLYGENLHLVVRAPMGGYRGYGATHSQSLEKLFFGLPEICVVAPSIAEDPGKTLKEVLALGTPTIFIENKLDYTSKLLQFIDKYYKIKSNKKVLPIHTIHYEEEVNELTVICYGGLLKNIAVMQKELYMDEEISIKILTLSMISPLPLNDLIELTKDDEKILIIEEGHAPFAWGDTVLSQLYQAGSKAKIKTIGAKTRVIPAAKNLEDDVLPDFNKIKELILDWVE